MSAMPWHLDGRGADDPATALGEFLDFFDFDERTEFVGLPPADASEGLVEIRPPFEGAPIDPDATPPADDVWSSTHVTLERSSEIGWVVTGAASPAVVVETPFDAQQVASPLDVRVTNRLAGEPVTLSMWSGATPVARWSGSGSGVFAVGTSDVVLRWADDLRGPAVLIGEASRLGGVVAVTTVTVVLADTTEPDDRAQPATVLGPVGEQRVGIEYQRGVRLTLHEPGPCDGTRRPVVVTGGPQSITFADEFTERGYVVADVAWRTPGYSGSEIDADAIRAVSFAVNDMGVAVQWLRAHADELCLAADRIVAMGYSFGGITSLSLAYTVGELEPGGVIAVDPLISDGAVPVDQEPPPGPPPGLDVYSNDPDVAVSFGGFVLADTIDAGEPPAMLVHGRNDQTVPFALAEATCAAATAVGVTCELVAHDDGHAIPEESFDDVDAFISRMFDDAAG